MSIEDSVIAFLTAQIPPTVNGLGTPEAVPVSAETPPGPPDRYIVVERTGGGEEQSSPLRATFAIRSCAPTLVEAVSLSRQVRRTMGTLPALPDVFSCRCSREYNFSDPADKRHRRYQAVFDVLYLED